MMVAPYGLSSVTDRRLCGIGTNSHSLELCGCIIWVRYAGITDTALHVAVTETRYQVPSVFRFVPLAAGAAVRKYTSYRMLPILTQLQTLNGSKLSRKL